MARTTVEPAVVRLGASQASDKELTQIIEIAVNCFYQPNDPQSDGEFLLRKSNVHNAIGQVCGNRRLAGIPSDIRDESMRLADIRLVPQDSGKEMLQLHVRLACAVQARDTDLSEQIIRKGIKYSRDQEIATRDRLGHQVLSWIPWTK